MRMKMPDHNIESSGYSNNDNYSDSSYDSDPEGYITPPNENSSNGGGNNDEDFSEYMWMENEEEFDKQEMQRLEEEALMEQCIEAMLHDEQEAQETREQSAFCSEPQSGCSKGQRNALSTPQVQQVNVERSTLNPLAAEFVPSVPPAST
ncbi:polyadenylate-binding protein-interacting protein 2 isoform X2 [Toxorhynchites rutilus septentrionalis]|nr:polyadenylate-binding protein-interacting protein 2 isoform X2 [Toxorhynchites rutilus septentrionalis]XP_055629969.1 polyadenylate-binding protein-interacting protein 2 isoform X2 [Toxorhynchites rutilus septentrionalis]XP_055629977.1 polyadenylate-binding protein-interacting protein 2 isoform X2 [Toxorhynchites rutilus septentrionalis]